MIENVPTENGRLPNGQFAPGNGFGRPTALRNRRTLFLEAIDAGEEEAIRQLKTKIADGELEAVKMYMDRVYPKPTSIPYETYITIPIGSIKSMRELQEAGDKIMTKVEDGELSLEIGDKLFTLLERKFKFVEATEVVAQLKEIKDILKAEGKLL